MQRLIWSMRNIKIYFDPLKKISNVSRITHFNDSFFRGILFLLLWTNWTLIAAYYCWGPI